MFGWNPGSGVGFWIKSRGRIPNQVSIRVLKWSSRSDVGSNLSLEVGSQIGCRVWVSNERSGPCGDSGSNPGSDVGSQFRCQVLIWILDRGQISSQELRSGPRSSVGFKSQIDRRAWVFRSNLHLKVGPRSSVGVVSRFGYRVSGRVQIWVLGRIWMSYPQLSKMSTKWLKLLEFYW